MTRIRLPIFIEKPLAKLGHAVMQNSLFQERERPTNNTKGKRATEKEKGQPQRMCMGAQVSDTT